MDPFPSFSLDKFMKQSLMGLHPILILGSRHCSNAEIEISDLVAQNQLFNFQVESPFSMPYILTMLVV